MPQQSQTPADHWSAAQKIFEWVLWTIFACLAISQSYEMVDEYFQRPETISSDTRTLDKFRLPGLSVCTHTKFGGPGFYWLIDPRTYEYPSISFETCYNESLVPGLVTACAVLTPELKTVNCSELGRVLVHVNWENVCYTFFGHHHEKHAAIYSSGVFSGLLFIELQVDRRLARGFGVEVVAHPVDEIPDLLFSSSGSSQLEVANAEIISITLEGTVFETESDPDIPIKCMNYTKRGYKNQGDCLYKCELHAFVERFGTWPGTLFGSVDSELRHLNITVSRISNEDRKKCITEVCPLDDCKRIVYSTSVHGQQTGEHGSKNPVRILIGAPFGTETHIKVRLKVSLNTLMSQVGGVFGLWIGLSAMGAVAQAKHLFLSFARLRKQNNVPRNAPTVVSKGTMQFDYGALVQLRERRAPTHTLRFVSRPIDSRQ